MFFLAILLPLLSLLGLAVAKPGELSKPFVLRTQVLPGHPRAAKLWGGRYVAGYHSGAGLADTVLLKGKQNAAKAFFNSTIVRNYNDKPVYRLEFEFDGTSTPYSLVVTDVDFYAQWLPTSITVGSIPPDQGNGYFFNSTGLQGRKKDNFGGWLVCDWYRGVPQLFVIQASYNPTVPVSCARVHLIKEEL